MELYTQLKEIGVLRQVDLFGVSDLDAREGDPSESSRDTVFKFSKAISIGIILNHEIINKLPERSERSVSVAYRHHCYSVINHRLDLVASELSSFLQKRNFRVYPVPASKRIDDNRLTGAFSHKKAAHLSGLGWIGKSCLLITPEAGPRIRFATILTDAPLEPTGPAMEERCGSCTKCVDICPVKAFTGRAFVAGEPREFRYDAFKCDRYFNKMRELNDWAECGMCLYICPFGLEAPAG